MHKIIYTPSTDSVPKELKDGRELLLLVQRFIQYHWVIGSWNVDSETWDTDDKFLEGLIITPVAYDFLPEIPKEYLGD